MPTVYIDGKKHTPSSGTLKKMKKKAAAEAKAPKAEKASKKKSKAKEKPPVPVKRSVKDKVRVPSRAVADVAAKGTLKGKVADLPSKNKKKEKKGHGIEMGKYRLK